MNEFIKNGKNVFPIPQGSLYDLEPGKVYDLSYDSYQSTFNLKLNGGLNMPGKLYDIANNTKFINRVLSYFNSTGKQTTGVMLYGEKGTGKSLTAKLIAQQSNLPIIVIDISCDRADLNRFFKQFNTPVCVLLDEVEKNFRTERLLGFLDGIEKTTKKLVIMTCNERNKTSQYLEDRCSRIRYAKNYTFANNLELLDKLLEDSTVKEKDTVRDFIKNYVSATSVDNIISIIEEMELFQDTGESIRDIVSNMSITLRPEQTEEQSTTTETSTANEETSVEYKELAIANDIDFDDYGDHSTDEYYYDDEDDCCEAA